MNKKFFILSLLLHILLFVWVGLHFNQSEVIPIRLEFSTKKPKFFHIAEKGKNETTKKGYWVIGIYTDSLYSLSGNSGLLISQAIEGYPAFKAGLRSGDIITECNGEPVIGTDEDHIAGDGPKVLTITYIRSGVSHTVVLSRAFILETN